MKYLTLIRAIALLHQHQRPVKTVEHRGRTLAYIEATKDDIALANQIAHDVLGRTLDELPPQTRRLLTLVHDMVQELEKEHGVAPREVRFTWRDVLEATQWSDNQLKVHCARLAEMEYLLVHGGGRGQHLQYELLFDGGDGRHLCGLIDAAELDQAHGYDGRKLGQEASKLVPSLGQVAPKLGPGWSEKSRAGIGMGDDLRDIAQKTPIHANGVGPVVAGA